MRTNHFIRVVPILMALCPATDAVPAQTQDGLAALVQLLERSSQDTLCEDVLDGILTGLAGRRTVAMPVRWPSAYAKLRTSASAAVRDRSLELALVFDDPLALSALRARASDSNAPTAIRNRSIEALVAKKPTDLAPLLLQLAADPVTRSRAVRGLAEYDHPATPARLLKLYSSFDATARQDAIQTLASRPTWAGVLLDAVASERVSRSDLTAYTARQLRNLGKDEITARVQSLWGNVRTTPAENLKLVAHYKQRLTPESLQRSSRSAGRAVYQQTCASCHRLFDSGGKIGPDITGSQRTNLDYLLENLLDPSATVAKDYQMEVIATTAGRVITGLVVSDSKQVVTVQTVNEKLAVPADEIESRIRSTVSMMPEGMLQKLSTRQLRELFAYLMGSEQVPLPEEFRKKEH